jgi:hypothetical protein
MLRLADADSVFGRFCSRWSASNDAREALMAASMSSSGSGSGSLGASDGRSLTASEAAMALVALVKVSER